MELRDYQEKAVQRIINNKRIINGSEAGTGKTVEFIEARHRLGGGLTVVIGNKSACGTWIGEFRKWYNDKFIYYDGNPYQRNQLRRQIVKDNIDIIIVNHKLFPEICAALPPLRFLVADEYHRYGLMNHKSNTFENFKSINSEYLILMTGTPVRRGPQDFFPPLHLINRKRFTSYWNFVYEHCIVNKEAFGHSIEARPKDVKGFNALVSGFMIRDKLDQADVPPMQRIPMTTIMTDKQEKAYKTLLETNILESDDGTVYANPNAMTNILRLRQLLVCPMILGMDEIGAGAVAVADQCVDEMDFGKPVVVFVPFEQAIPYLEEYFKISLDCSVHVISGKVKDPRGVADAFQNDKTVRRMLLATIQSSVSYDAYVAAVSYFLGCSWSNIENIQAERRTRRIGQKEKTRAYYVLYDQAITDELILEKLNSKESASNWILNTNEVLKAIKNFKIDT